MAVVAAYPTPPLPPIFVEELGWAGLCSTDCNLATGAEGVCLGWAGVRILHLPTYLSAPISGGSALRDVSVMVIVIPFAVCFRI
jgi:hypothetical protein